MAAEISKRRALVLHLFIFFLIGGTGYHLVTDKENWPLLNYPMFSNVIEPNVPYTQMQLFGVTREEPSSEIPLRNFAYIQPFTDDLLTASFLRLAAEPKYEENRRQVLDEALRDCLERYESMRVAGRHDGPRLKAIRLYIAPQWRPDGQGDGDRQLIARVRQP